MLFLMPIDLNKNELQNAVIQNLATAPTNKKKGQLYYNTNSDELLYWNGTAWIAGVKVTDRATDPGKVVTGLSGNTTLLVTDVKNLELDGITPVSDGYVSEGMTLEAAITALDTAVKNAVAGGGEVNQNAWSFIKVGTTTIEADSKTDTLELVPGQGIDLTPDATNDKVTVATKPLTVSLTESGGSYTSTTTYAQVLAAVNAGQQIELAFGNDKMVAANVYSSSSEIMLISVVESIPGAPDCMILKVTSGNVWSFSSFAIADADTLGAVVAAIAALEIKVGTGPMHYLGESSTAINDGGNEDPTIGGTAITTKHAGDVVLWGNNEYIYNSQNKWELLGAEGEYVLKTQTINGKTLTGNITLALSDLTDDALHRTVTDSEKSTWNGKQDAIPANTYDAYGAAAGVQTNLTTHTGNGDIHVTAAQKTAWTGKQDAISDLATIRSGAAKGATSLQLAAGSIAANATSGTVSLGAGHTPVAVSVWTGDGDMVMTDVEFTNGSVVCTVAAAYGSALTIRVAYL